MRRSRWCWTLVCVVCGAGLATGAAAQDESVTAESPESAETEVHPASVRRAAQYRVRYIRTPDGTYWDMWGEREFRKVFNRVVDKVPITRERREVGFVTKTTIGHKWEMEDTRDARAWAVGECWKGSKKPRYWNRTFGGTPALWESLTAEEMPFIYINEDERDVLSKDEDLRATRVIAQLGENVYNVAVSRGRGLLSMKDVSASRLEGGVLVQVDSPILTRNGYLNGEFILWPDETIDIPAGYEGPSYRYIAIEDMVPTTEEFVVAVQEERAQMAQWIYKRQHGSDRWERQVFPIRTRQRVAVAEKSPGPDEPKTPTKQGGVKVTHTLVLTNGDWVEGQLLEDTGTEIRFLVVVGSIAGERTYAKADVGRVVEK